MEIPRGLLLGVTIGAVLTGLLMAVGAPLLDVGSGAKLLPQGLGHDHDADRVRGERDDDDDDDDDDSSATQRVSISGGRRQIRLDAAERTLAGIVVAGLASAQAVPEQHLVGMVVDTAALTADTASLTHSAAGIALQRELVTDVDARRAALADLDGAAALGAKREIATLERAGLQARVDLQLKLEARARRADEISTRWGAALLAALDASAPMRSALATGVTALVEFSVPARGMTTSPPDTVLIGLDGQRDLAVAATIVAPAPGSGGRAQGRAWYAAVSGLDLRRDMRPDVWVPTADTAISGLLVPRAAVVWRGGQAWYYAAVAGSRYERRPLDALASHPRGYLLDPAGAPREIVVAGAQALLAEEFHAAIPVEDDD